jgi:hypothetical protein
MTAGWRAGEQFVNGFAPPGQADLSRQRLARDVLNVLELMLEGVERDQVGARGPVADETAGKPPIVIGPPNRGVEVAIGCRP